MTRLPYLAPLVLAGLLAGCRGEPAPHSDAPPPPPTTASPDDLSSLQAAATEWTAYRHNLDSLEGTWISPDGISHFFAWRQGTNIPVIHERLGADAVGQSEMWHFYRGGQLYHTRTHDIRTNPSAPGGADTVNVRLFFGGDRHTLLSEATVNGVRVTLQGFEVAALQGHAETLYRKALALRPAP